MEMKANTCRKYSTKLNIKDGIFKSFTISISQALQYFIFQFTARSLIPNHPYKISINMSSPPNISRLASTGLCHFLCKQMLNISTQITFNSIQDIKAQRMLGNVFLLLKKASNYSQCQYI